MTSSINASVSTILNSLQSDAGSTSTSNTSGSYGRLKTALNQAITNGSGDALPLYQSLVTLSKNDSSSDATAAQTYNAKGLLTALKFATNLSNPLLQSEDTSEANALIGNTTNGTSLAALYASIEAAAKHS